MKPELVIEFIKNRITENFADKIVGIYLFGSLTYDDFNPERSDIDLQIITKDKIDKDEVAKVEQLFNEISNKFPEWKGRVECSFTPLEYYSKSKPFGAGRPYFGESFYADATYGNEWLINYYLLYKYGKTLYGSEFKEIVEEIDIKDVQEAARNDLEEEWEPKMNDDEYLSDPHNQSYMVLNLCRILYTILQADAGSKTQAANWVKETYPQWTELIQKADSWRYGDEINMAEEAIKFLRFVVFRSD